MFMYVFRTKQSRFMAALCAFDQSTLFSWMREHEPRRTVNYGAIGTDATESNETA